MTKPATMRWNVVPSKNFLSARYLNEPPVFGASFGSSVISKSPQLVETAATYVVPGLSVSLGLARSPAPFGVGASTFSHPTGPSAVGAGVGAAADCSSSSAEPQAATST